ncbi:MAG TPA: globin family protein [Burkholderiales bacterium]|nr:globin family protein [Burkholderiales bacterium]
MTPRQIALVRQSWVKVQPIADEAARTFYERLFELQPDVRPLFRGDLLEQGRKLMTMLAVAIHALERVDALGTLQDLGARHERYGVRPEHYPRVGEALIWTLEKGLGASFTEEVREAWMAAYAKLARRMQTAYA